MSETGGAWKVYQKQWIIVFAADDATTTSAGRNDACWEVWSRDYETKVDVEDSQVVPAYQGEAGRLPWYLKLRLWVLIAEYTDSRTAERVSRLMSEDPGAQWASELNPVPTQVVRTGSPEERSLLDYGRKRLVS